MAISDIDQWAGPGMGTPTISSEAEILWGVINSWQVVGVNLASTAVDASQTTTTTLQRGLILGRITSSGLYRERIATSTDGSQIARGVLYQGINMLDPGSGVAAQKQGRMVWFGNVKAGQCNGLDLDVRRDLSGRIWFDDDFMKNNGAPVGTKQIKTTSYTVVAGDNGSMFTTLGAAGAVTFTLPAIGKGYSFLFFNQANQNMIVASAEGTNMATFNNLAASSVAFSTANNKVGGCVEISSDAAGTSWLVRQPCTNTMTVA